MEIQSRSFGIYNRTHQSAIKGTKCEADETTGLFSGTARLTGTAAAGPHEMTEFKCNGPGFKAHLDKTWPSISVCSIVEVSRFVTGSTCLYRIPGRRQLYHQAIVRDWTLKNRARC